MGVPGATSPTYGLLHWVDPGSFALLIHSKEWVFDLTSQNHISVTKMYSENLKIYKAFINLECHHQIYYLIYDNESYAKSDDLPMMEGYGAQTAGCCLNSPTARQNLFIFSFAQSFSS